MVSAIATDSQDRVFAFQRKDPPILIFDRDGNLLDSWGNGAFSFAHGIYIDGDDTVYLTDRDNSVCLVYTIDGKPSRCWDATASIRIPAARTRATFAPVPPARSTTPPNWCRHPRAICTWPTATATPASTGSAGRPAQAVLGQPGKSEPGHFHLPHSLLIHNDTIFLCDREKPPDAAVQPGRRVHRNLGRHPASHGHLRGQRRKPGDQRGQRQRLVGPGQRGGHLRQRAVPLRLSRPRPRQLGDSRGDIYVGLSDGTGIDKFVRQGSSRAITPGQPQGLPLQCRVVWS